MNAVKKLLKKQIVDLPKLESKITNTKRDIEELDALVKPGVVRYGSSYTDDGESGCDWWVFRADMDNGTIIKNLIEMGVCEDTDRGVYDDNDWDCSGKCMRNEPRTRRTNTRVLVTQSWCFDF